MISSPKLTSVQIAASRESVRQYEANMAIEGMYLTDDERQFIEQLNAEGVGYEEGIQRTLADLKAKGIIPATTQILAAE